MTGPPKDEQKYKKWTTLFAAVALKIQFNKVWINDRSIVYYQDDRSRLRIYFLIKGFPSGKRGCSATPPISKHHHPRLLYGKKSGLRVLKHQTLRQIERVVVFVIVIVYAAIWTCFLKVHLLFSRIWLWRESRAEKAFTKLSVEQSIWKLTIKKVWLCSVLL